MQPLIVCEWGSEMNRLAQEEFIKRAMDLHPEYSYQKALYKNNKTKVTITCPIHGDFEVRPDSFLKGAGCIKCSGKNKSTNGKFVAKAMKVHNGFFSYEKTEYKGANKKVVVTCPIHGDFEVKANNHLMGMNCAKCTSEGIVHKITPLPQKNPSTKKLTRDAFLIKAREIHGWKYDYAKTEYKNGREKVIVTCPEHGDFQISPYKHLSGVGCPSCAKNKPLTTEEFIKKARNIHGLNYSYEKSEYVSTHNPVIITCPIHGDFQQSPANHFRGQGCPQCTQSRMEEEISILLEKNGIVFEAEKTFDWLKDKKSMYLDFYLPEYQIGIECQGLQHFEPLSIFGGQEKFENAKRRDTLKKQLCINHGLTLLYYANYEREFPYIVYTKKNELLKDILKSEKKSLPLLQTLEEKQNL